MVSLALYWEMLRVTEAGLYCEAGDFFIDPWRGVPRAIITHAHADHARRGSQAYLCAHDGVRLLRSRLGLDISAEGLNPGETREINGVRVSLHPAGHVLGSVQVRVEHRGEIWVVSGDYKRHADPTCRPFEPVKCHVFVTECTFGLPIYRWPDPVEVATEINDWWGQNQLAGKLSVLFGYSLGKAQRLLSGLDPGVGPIFAHKAVMDLVEVYRAEGVVLPAVSLATKEGLKAAGSTAILIGPPALDGSLFLKGLGDYSTAFASGWMAIRGTRRRRSADRGFVLSDHVDWPTLIQSIRDTGAERILPTHGWTGPLVRWLTENGWQAEALSTRFGESEEQENAAPEVTESGQEGASSDA